MSYTPRMDACWNEGRSSLFEGQRIERDLSTTKAKLEKALEALKQAETEICLWQKGDGGSEGSQLALMHWLEIKITELETVED